MSAPAQSGRTAAQPVTGFAALRDDLGERVCGARTVSQAVADILTFGNRQPLEDGLRSLTRRQLALLRCMGHALPEPASAAPGAVPGVVWYLGIFEYGRILLTDQLPLTDCYRLFAWLPVPVEVAAAVDSKTCSLDDADRELADFMAGVNEDNKRNMVDRVGGAILHMDPVLLYVNDSTFTNFGPFNNLSLRPLNLFDRLREAPVGDWLPDEKQFISCFYWLIAAGLRGEEFNGVQLTPAAVHAQLDAYIESYGRALGMPSADNKCLLDEKARQAAALRQSVLRDRLIFREINGITFRKVERLGPRPRTEISLRDMPEDLAHLIETACDVSVARFHGVDELFRACVESSVLLPAQGSAPMSGVERLLMELIVSAAETLRGDIAMSRGIRDLRNWHRAMDARMHREICDWPSTSYFCAVFPASGMRARLAGNPAHLARILTACSTRMQFNSWHYMPGYVPEQDVPAGRNYYRPPRMPDVAVWSDQHHTGHVLASVRYSIRSPAPLTYRGEVFPGIVDLRVFRAEGSPFTEEELFRAVRHTEYLRCLYQAIADFTESSDCEVVIRAFDKPWIERYCAALPEEHRAAGETAVL